MLEIPIKHGEGQFVATAEQLATVEGDGLVVFRYARATAIVDEDAQPERRDEQHRGRPQRSAATSSG